MTLLYINACVRPQSRTKRLADYVISKLPPQKIRQLDLDKCGLKYADAAFLQKRSELIAARQFDDPVFSYAKEFAAADNIVIAAPYWDFSFPALLKMYIENVNMVNLVFKYSATGEIVPLCKAENLYYVTTKGGYNPDNYGYEYIKALCQGLYGIKNVFLIKAEGLDIQGNDSNEILRQAEKYADKILEGNHI